MKRPPRYIDIMINTEIRFDTHRLLKFIRESNEYDLNANQSLVLGTTVAPDLNTKESVVDSFTGLVGIIQQINNNIGAIGQAMLNSSVIESKYRQSG